MRLLINTASVLKGGGVQVAVSFLRECREIDGHEFGVILGVGVADALRTNEFPSNFKFYQVDYRPAQRVLSARRAGVDLERFEAEFKPDVVFTTSGPSYWRPRAPHLMGFNVPHYLYPDSPYFLRILGPMGRLRWRVKSAVVRRFTRQNADAWVVQTDDVKDRLQKWVDSENVFAVSNTISDRFLSAKNGSRQVERKVPDREGRFRLLILSSYYRHKNLEVVDAIIDLLRERGHDDMKFVMTLPQRDFERVVSAKNRPWVENLGPQRPEDCPSLYEQTDALFLPTLLECFSANYVEAMAMSRPIVTTNLGFARTICADAALYFEPMDAHSALQRIRELINNVEVNERIVAAGRGELQRFGTARDRAETYLSLCQRLADGELTS